MKIYLTTVAAVFFFFCVQAFCQSESHVWKPLGDQAKQKIWYDQSFLDTLHSEKFNVWILQMYNPPLHFDEIDGRIFRTRLLYAVDLKLMKYGLLKAAYYGINNKLICSFDYPIENYSDSLKYTYPVLDSPSLAKLFELIKKKISEKSGNTE